MRSKSKWSAPLSYGHYYPAPKIPTRRPRWPTVLGLVLLLASWGVSYAVCLHYWPR